MAVILIFGLGACSEQALSKELVFTAGLKENEIFEIEGLSATAEEARLLLANVKNQYKEAFGEKIWEQEIEGQPFPAYAREMVKNQLAQLKCMALYAERAGIDLTEEENESLFQAAGSYYDSLRQEEREALNVSVEEIHLIYSQLALSEKVYERLTQDADDEISDAEAKVIVVWHIFKARGQEDEETIKELSEIRRQIITEGVDFASMAREHSEDERLEYAFGRGELEQSLEDAAFALAAGAVSGIVETEEGYHIIKCVSDYDAEKTALNKEKLRKERRQEAFDREYLQFTRKLTSEFNDRAWGQVSFEDVAVVDNVGLYRIYEEYWKG